MQDSNTNNIISIDNLIQNQDIYYYRCGLYKNKIFGENITYIKS